MNKVFPWLRNCLSLIHICGQLYFIPIKEVDNMAYVPVPKDLTKVETKVMFNLTRRQLVCFTAGALVGDVYKRQGGRSQETAEKRHTRLHL